MNNYHYNWKDIWFQGFDIQDGDRTIGQSRTTGFMSGVNIVDVQEHRFIFRSRLIVEDKIKIYNRAEDQIAEVKYDLLKNNASLLYKGETYTYKSPSFGFSGGSWERNGEKVMSFTNKFNGGWAETGISDTELRILLFFSGIYASKQFIGWVIVCLLIIYAVLF